jgi:hypothetical protein
MECKLACTEEDGYGARIYRKVVSHKLMEQRAKSDYLEKERFVLVGDEYAEKSHSVTLNGNCQLSNPVRDTTISLLPDKSLLHCIPHC